jgi:tetratricopeptide (TPR) repeat protein
MCLLALGRAEEALLAFDRVCGQRPNMAVAWYHSHAPALELQGLDEAIRRLERALACTGPVNGNYRALLAAYRWLQGDTAKAEELARKGRHRVLIEGLAALKPHFSPAFDLFAISAHLLTRALQEAKREGLVLEFGVRRGTSLRHIASQAGQEVHGFDSFQGLPEAWRSDQPGLLTTQNQLPPVPANAHLHPGWFEDTLPDFLNRHSGPVRLVNIDSDIYTSARTVLFALAPRLVTGSVVVFDELIGNPSWKDDEFKALCEFVAAFKVQFEIFAVSPATKQVALRIL